MRAKYLCGNNSYTDFVEACKDVRRDAKMQNRTLKISKFNPTRGKFETIKTIKP